MRFVKALLVITGLACSLVAKADLIQVCGDVSGTWNVDTVIAVCDIQIPPYDTLEISPGTVVLFQGYFKFSVQDGAVLKAVGTPSNYVTFDERFAGNGWHGIHFDRSSDSSRLEYCTIKHGFSQGAGEVNNGGGVYIYQTDPRIRNCVFDSCTGDNGGGIYCAGGAAPMIYDCTFQYCNGYLGGAIFSYQASPTVRKCTFDFNTANNGGAINFTESSSTIDSSIFKGNQAAYRGGAITCEYGSSPIISTNTIDSNVAWAFGGGGGIACYYNAGAVIEYNSIINNRSEGIGVQDCSPAIHFNEVRNNTGVGINLGNYYGTVRENLVADNHWFGIGCIGGNPRIIRNTVTGNVTTDDGGGMHFADCNPKIKRNVIAGNSAGNGGGISLLRANADSILNNTITDNFATLQGGAIYCNNSNPVVQNCILYGNSSSSGSQIHPVNGSTPVVTYCDVEGGWFGTGNIDAVPRFRNTSTGDYHLQSHTNPDCGSLFDSPCIDAGNPALDDDSMGCDWGLGTIVSDMGAYGGTLRATGIDDNQAVPKTFYLLQNYPNPFNPTTSIRYNLPRRAHITIEIFDLLGARIKVLIDETREAGTHVADWDGRNDRDDPVASGIYLYRLRAGDQNEAKKMLLLK